MDSDVITFVQVAIVIVAMTTALTAVGLIAFRVVMRTRRLPPPVQRDHQLEQLQQSVDAIAVEVERIAEAQRFSAKLLAERTEASQLNR